MKEVETCPKKSPCACDEDTKCNVPVLFLFSLWRVLSREGLLSLSRQACLLCGWSHLLALEMWIYDKGSNLAARWQNLNAGHRPPARQHWSTIHSSSSSYKDQCNLYQFPHFTHWAFLLKGIYVLKPSKETEKCFRLSQPSTLDRLKMKLQCRLIRELSIRVDLLIEHSRGGEVGGSSQTGETDYLQNPHRNCPSPASTPVQWHRQLCADL